jgi:hypothetical protein
MEEETSSMEGYIYPQPIQAYRTVMSTKHGHSTGKSPMVKLADQTGVCPWILTSQDNALSSEGTHALESLVVGPITTHHEEHSCNYSAWNHRSCYIVESSVILGVDGDEPLGHSDISLDEGRCSHRL